MMMVSETVALNDLVAFTLMTGLFIGLLTGVIIGYMARGGK